MQWNFYKYNFIFVILIILIGFSFSLKPFLKHDSGFSSQQDTTVYHAQYYLLQKALSDSANVKKREQIKINMDRWKAMPINWGKHYLLINIADFSLNVMENDSIIMSMKAIVGRTYRKTPVFNAKMRSIIFNPSWNIPETILKNDVLPLVLKDTSYLRKKHIQIYQTKKGGIRKEISADSINWKAVSARYFPYELTQSPGKDNALGVVKFMFPNQYSVYMHDTPAKELFEETERTFSSGCIRISNAIDLAEYLLKGKWSRKQIMKTIQSGETVTVTLSEPIETYIEYFTAWVDDYGMVQFRKDIYEEDTLLTK